MGSLSLCCNAIPAQSIKLGFHQNPNCLAISSSLNLQSTSVFRLQYDYEAYNHGPSNGLAISTHSPKFFSMAHVISNGSNGFKNAAKLLTSRRLPLVHASNKPSEETIEKTEASTSGDTSTPQGPPFLTILAGIIVFALVLWVIGSIVSWLIGLLGLIFSK